MKLPAPRCDARLKSAWLLLFASLVSPQWLCAQSTAPATAGNPAAQTSALADAPSRVRELLDSDPAAAVALAEPLFAVAQEPNRAAIGVELAVAYVKVRRIADAQSLVDTLSSESGTGNDATLLRLRLLIATANRDWRAIDGIASKVNVAAQSAPDMTARVELLATFGTALLAQNKFPEAQGVYQQALDALGESDSPLRFDALQKLGVAQAQQGRYPDAIESFNRAENVGKRIGLGEDPTFLLRFGGVFLYTGDSAHAIAYLKRALAAADADPGGSVNRMSIYNNLGNAYYGEKNFEQAARWFETSVAYSKEHGDSPGHALNNLGAVLREWGRNDEALAKFREALLMAQSDQDKEGIAVSSKNIGESLIGLDQRNKAVAPLERAYAIYAETDQRPKRLELYPVMIENFESLGRTGDALKLLREYKTLNDDVVNVESRERVSKLESAIDLAEKQKQLAASERDRIVQAASIQALELQQDTDRRINRLLIFAIVALAILIVLQIRDQRLKSRVNRELTAKTIQIEEQRRALAALNDVVRRQSQEDVLTGLRNRRFLSEWMAESNRRRASDHDNAHSRETTLLILIDIDHFKSVNDRYGHAAGDKVLVEFAGILRECMRDSDLIVRWGGEEFVWLCPNTPASAAPMLCERFRSVLRARTLSVGDDALILTASMGFAPYPLWAWQPADWQLSMRIADYALYQCKSSGRDRWLGFAAGSTPEIEALAKSNVAALVAAGNLVRVELPN